MAKKGRPKRSNPQAERKIFRAELENCPVCNSSLTSTGNSTHSRKTVQTLKGEQYVIAYSRLCNNQKCEKYKHHYHAVGHLGVALPGETYGLDIVAFIGWHRDREQRRFAEIHKMLNQKGVQINERSVGRLYRLYQVLLKSGHKEISSRLVKTEEEYGGLILASDGLKPDGCGGTLYILYEVLGGTPVTAMWQEVADAVHLTAWLRQSEAVNFNVLATMSDHEEALMIALNSVWSFAPHQLCQSHFIGGLSKPIHEADQKLQTDLKGHLQKLPKPPKLKAEQEANSTVNAEMAQKNDPSTDDSHSRKNHCLKKANQTSREPLLANLLFKQQPTILFERESGLPINQSAILWDQYYRYYRTAVQDACNRSRRKPFQLGGLAGFQQLVGILSHIEQRELTYGPDPFLSSLQSRLRDAIEFTSSQAKDIEKATTFLQQVEHLLAVTVRPTPEPIINAEAEKADGWHPIPPGKKAKYQVGDIATAMIKQVWQFLFRPIKKIRFYNGRFWYFFEDIGTGYCEDDILLASEVGKRAEGFIWPGPELKDTNPSQTSTTQAQSPSSVSSDSTSVNQSARCAALDEGASVGQNSGSHKSTALDEGVNVGQNSGSHKSTTLDEGVNVGQNSGSHKSTALDEGVSVGQNSGSQSLACSTLDDGGQKAACTNQSAQSTTARPLAETASGSEKKVGCTNQSVRAKERSLTVSYGQNLTNLEQLESLIVTSPNSEELLSPVDGTTEFGGSTNAQDKLLFVSAAELNQGPNSSASEVSSDEKIQSEANLYRPRGISQAVRQQLEQMFKQFQRKTKQEVVCQRVVKKWQKMALTWLPGILYCYEIAGLPRDNLELEAVYGKLRANQRRISGRKETSSLRLFGAGEVMNLMINSEAELLQWCQTVALDKQTYRKQRRLHEEFEERQRWLKRLHRNPIQALEQLDQQFYDTLHKLGFTPVTTARTNQT